MEIQTREDGTLASFVLEQDGKRTGVIMTENTRAWPRERVLGQTYDKTCQVFQEELRDAEVIAWCGPFRTKLETAKGCFTAYRAKSANVIGSLKRNALTLQDGTAVDILSSDPGFFQWTYRLPDGTELLRARAPFDDPVSACVNGDEAFGTLSDKARKKIFAYYAEQKPLYDEREELEKCYAEWKKLGENYSMGYIQQNVWLTAYNRQVLYFKSLAELPGGECADISLGTAFDRESGEKLDNWKVFTVPEEEVCRRLAEWVYDESLWAEMAEVLKPEWIVVSEEGLTVQFPAGTLSKYWNQAYRIWVGPEKVMEAELLQPWAIPYNW